MQKIRNEMKEIDEKELKTLSVLQVQTVIVKIE